MRFFNYFDVRDPLVCLQRLWAGATLLLLALSWRLWMPEFILAGSRFPRVPLLDLAPPLAAAIDLASLCGLLAALAMIVLRRSAPWQGFATTAVCLAALMLTNQHRLQPWAYQGWLYALIFACLPPQSARRFVIALTISIYAYSSLGKFDQQFLHTVGPDLITALLPGLDRTPANADALARASLALPVMELALAIFLAVPRTRLAAGYAAFVMHGALLVILGPLGLRHSPAVIAWNAFLAVQAWLLFVARPPGGQSVTAAASQSPQPVGRGGLGAAATAANLVVAAALLLPLLERRGYWDHWLSWSLYSPHTSRVDIQIHELAIDSLPAGAAEYLSPSGEIDGWYDLAIDRWSLAELAVPVYPQARFQLGVAMAVASELDSPDAIRITIRGIAQRRSGRRSQRWLMGRDQIANETQRYWLLPHRQSFK